MSEKDKMLKKEVIEMLIDNAKKIEKDSQFRYYFGLAKQYVKEDLLDEFDEFVISNYRYANYNTVIKVTAILAYKINSKDDNSIYDTLNELITTIDSYNLDRVAEIMDTYIENGQKIKPYLFKGITNDFVQKQKVKINNL